MSTTTKSSKRSVEGWGKAKTHVITLPSGYEVEVEIPDLPKMIKTGQLPNHLIDAALGAVEGKAKVTREFVIEQSEFVNQIVSITVVDPVVTPEQVLDLPVEDRELIAEIATRQRDLDALGHHIGGLHTNEDFRNFRGLVSGGEDLAGL